MSAAIAAADTEDIVGIDGPSPSFLRRLARNAAGAALDVREAVTLLSSVRSATMTALAFRLAAVIWDRPGLRLVLGGRSGAGGDWLASPAEQADHEREQIRKSRAVTNALESSSASRCRERTREEHMAARVDALARHGSVTAVVGLGHLAPIADRVGAAGADE